MTTTEQTVEFPDRGFPAWGALLDELVESHGLDYYPEGALAAALGEFADTHARAADPDRADDRDEVRDLVVGLGGWSA